MGTSLTDFPLELICEIAHYLEVVPDVQNFALTSKGIRLFCAPELYREVEHNSPLWKSWVDSYTRPSWASHVRVLAISIPVEPESKYLSIDFRSFLHILEDLTTLKEIHTSSSHAIISSIEGLEELALRVPSLRVFQWEPSYNITLVGKFPLRNLEVLELSLHGSRLRASESPFTFLADLSEAHPQLRSLSLHLNGPYSYTERSRTWNAAINPLLSNIFGSLVHFTLKGCLETPDGSVLYSFVESHPLLRSFTLHAWDETLSLPGEAFPHMEYLEGPAGLLVAVCDASAKQRSALVEIYELDSGRADKWEVYAARVFPKLPNLRAATIKHGYDVTPERLQTFGEFCPKLTNLSVHDPRWVGSLDDFTRAFKAFPHLTCLDTSRDFGWGSHLSGVQPGTVTYMSLVMAAVHEAPKLSEVWWGNEASARGPERINGVEVIRRKGGEVRLNNMIY